MTLDAPFWGETAENKSFLLTIIRTIGLFVIIEEFQMVVNMT